jgi:hypothetical protein
MTMRLTCNAPLQDSLPLDIALLHAEAGLRSYLAAAIGPKDHPLGVLLLARERPGAFDDRRCGSMPCDAKLNRLPGWFSSPLLH